MYLDLHVTRCNQVDDMQEEGEYLLITHPWFYPMYMCSYVDPDCSHLSSTTHPAPPPTLESHVD